MFVIIYKRSDDIVQLVQTETGINIVGGDWRVDTEEDGSVAVIEELEVALSRVLDIRKKGGEACLTTIIE